MMQMIMEGKFCYWIYLLPVGAILFLGYLNNSYLEITYAICAALFWLIQFRLSSGLEKDESAQRKQCNPAGFFVLVPATGVIIAGISIPFRPYTDGPLQMTYCVIAISAILFICLLSQIIVQWGNNSPAGRFLRLSVAASMSAPMSLIVVLLLHVTQADEAALGSMSAVIFGSIAFFIAVNMILVSTCGYKSTRDSIGTISALIKSNKLVFARVSILKDALLVAGKLTISVISFSFFMFANALYSTGMGIARFIAVRMHGQDRKKQIENYRIVGVIISASSICYVLYSVRLFFGGKTGDFSMNIALLIALYTFVEFGINVKEAFRLRKSKALEAKALRAISFSATLLCFVLTQTAILSFAAQGDYSFGNALSGVAFGGMAALTGLFVILDSFSHKKLSAP